MNIFNPNNLRNKQRFPVAIVAGVTTSVLCAFLIGSIVAGIGWYYSLLYVAAGYVIGNAIKFLGRGIDLKFSILSAVCLVLCVFLSDFFALSQQLSTFSFQYLGYSFEMTLRGFIGLSPQGLIRLLMIVYAGYLAYYEAKIM